VIVRVGSPIQERMEKLRTSRPERWILDYIPFAQVSSLVCEVGTIVKYDGSTFAPLSPSSFVTREILYGSAWKPDGSYALICGYGGTLLKYDGSAVSTITTGTSSILWDVAWKPDGTYALTCGDSGTVLKYDGLSIVSLFLP